MYLLLGEVDKSRSPHVGVSGIWIMRCGSALIGAPRQDADQNCFENISKATREAMSVAVESRSGFRAGSGASHLYHFFGKALPRQVQFGGKT